METKVSRRYAQSLMDIAIENKITDKLNDDMQLIAKTIEENRELLLLLKNPIINSDKKHSVIHALFGGKVDTITNAFLKLIAAKGREKYLGDIAGAFVSMYKTLKGIKTAYVTTAFKMDDEIRSQVMALLKRSNGEKVELVENIDKSIIGGFVLKIGDIQFDTSISRKLKGLKNEFDDNLYIREY